MRGAGFTSAKAAKDATCRTTRLAGPGSARSLPMTLAHFKRWIERGDTGKRLSSRSTEAYDKVGKSFDPSKHPHGKDGRWESKHNLFTDPSEHAPPIACRGEPIPPYAEWLKMTKNKDGDLARKQPPILLSPTRPPLHNAPIPKETLDEYPEIRDAVRKPGGGMDRKPANVTTTARFRQPRRRGRRVTTSRAGLRRNRNQIRLAGGSWDKKNGVWIITPSAKDKLAHIPGLVFTAKKLRGFRVAGRP